MKRKTILITTLVMLLLLMLYGCGQEAADEEMAEDGQPVVKVGCDDYSPFSYTDENGIVTGIDVELAREAFGRMGYKPQFVFINWEDKDQLLADGEIDCIWSSFTETGREDQYAWAGPYMKSNQVVAVREDSDIYTLADLQGKIMAVQSTTKPEEAIKKHDGTLPPLEKVISVQKRDLAFMLLAKGYVDAMAGHNTVIEQCKKNTNLKVRILEQPLQSVGVGVAFAKDDTRGINVELGNVLRQMRSDGTTEQIIGKYFSNPERYLEEPHEGN